MPLVEETLTSYSAYKERVDGLEALGPSKNRVVFIFRQAEGNNALNTTLEGIRKKEVKGTLISVMITKAEFANANCPYKTDSKFKVNELPFGVVFNQKLTLGRDWIHKKIVGDGAFTEVKILDLFK